MAPILIMKANINIDIPWELNDRQITAEYQTIAWSEVED
jgi:hypothetical protein